MRRRRTSWMAGLAMIPMSFAPGTAQERTVPDVFTPGEETVWLVEVNGEEIGHNWTRYEGPVALAGIRAHRFTEQVVLDSEVSGGRLLQKYTVESWTDDGGHPLRVSFRAEVSDVLAAIDATFADGEVEARVRQGPADNRRELEVSADAFLLANNFVSHLDLALALAAPPEGEPGSLTFFSANALREFPLTLKPVAEEGPGAGDEPEGGGRRFHDSLGEILHVDEDGRLETVEVPAQNLIFRRASAEIERFSIALPEPVTEAGDIDREDVRVEYRDVSIAGTITRPQGGAGPFPAVFFISGSGGQDRDGFSSGIDLGTHEILDRLTREGFLVLRVDDRGVGGSTGPTGGMTFDDLVEDARHAVGFLQERPDVDASRIAVIGHSEGGQTAPVLAGEMDLAAVVLMAAPGRTVDELIREQLARGARISGKSAEEIEALDREISSFFERVEAGEPIDAAELPAELAPFAGSGPWLRSHLAQDPIANLKEVEEPVLILQGARDIQVSVARDAERLAAALEDAGHPDYELVVFPELDHLFKRTEGGDASGLDYLKKRPIDPGFLDVLVGWLRERLLNGPGGE